MPEIYHNHYLDALRDFRSAQRRAILEQIVSRLKGHPADLLPYEEVRAMLRGEQTGQRNLRDIPLDAIVGSVGRYNDFTRSFMPKGTVSRQRWANVQIEMTSLEGVRPIEVYQIGEVYFVKDGNHRVSVARQLGSDHIEAYVTEIATKTPLAADDDLDDLILKAEYAEFLEQTQLDQTRPHADLRVTLPGRYGEFLEQIEARGYVLSSATGAEVSLLEAAARWYDEVQQLTATLVEDLGLNERFPERTPLDLYAWICRHRQHLSEELDWDLGLEGAAADLAGRVRLEVSRTDGQQPDILFARILVPVSGAEVGWYALAQALQIARREGGQILGLHVVDSEEKLASPQVAVIQAEFLRRCHEAGVPAQMAVDRGNVAKVIAARARFADLLVLRLVYPPPPGPIARLGSGFRTIIQRVGCPVLVVPRTEYPLERLLLAYDGSSGARMALYIGAYLAERWQAALSVVVATEEAAIDGDALLNQTTAYLKQRQIDATYLVESGFVVDVLLRAAEQQHCDLILMGSYGASGWRELITASTVDAMLRRARRPLLICR